MTSLLQQPNTVTILASIAGAPIILAFLIGSLPVLVPVLFYRWLAQLMKPVVLDAPAPAICLAT